MTSAADLIDRIQSGDLRGATESLVVTYADEVMGMCTAMVRNRTVAEDLTQDVFGRAFASLGGFRGEASPRTWLLRIARNRCIDHLRAAKRDPWGGDNLEPEEPDAQPDDAPLPPDLVLRRDDVHDALAELAEADRALVVLRFRNGLDYSELAMAFGIKEGTVRMRVSRALAKMRRSLEAKHAEPELAASMDMDIAAPGAPPPAPASAPMETLADFEAGDEVLREEEAPLPQMAKRRAGPGILERIGRAVRGQAAPPIPSGPPPHHPLTAFFAATGSPLPEELRTRLLAQARSHS